MQCPMFPIEGRATYFKSQPSRRDFNILIKITEPIQDSCLDRWPPPCEKEHEGGPAERAKIPKSSEPPQHVNGE